MYFPNNHKRLHCYHFFFFKTRGDQPTLYIYLNVEKLQGSTDTVAHLKPIFFFFPLYIYNFRSLRLLCFHYELFLPWEAKSLILLDSLWVLPARIWELFCLWKRSPVKQKIFHEHILYKKDVVQDPSSLTPPLSLCSLRLYCPVCAHSVLPSPLHYGTALV